MPLRGVVVRRGQRPIANILSRRGLAAVGSVALPTGQNFGASNFEGTFTDLIFEERRENGPSDNSILNSTSNSVPGSSSGSGTGADSESGTWLTCRYRGNIRFGQPSASTRYASSDTGSDAAYQGQAEAAVFPSDAEFYDGRETRLSTTNTASGPGLPVHFSPDDSADYSVDAGSPAITVPEETKTGEIRSEHIPGPSRLANFIDVVRGAITGKKADLSAGENEARYGADAESGFENDSGAENDPAYAAPTMSLLSSVCCTSLASSVSTMESVRADVRELTAFVKGGVWLITIIAVWILLSLPNTAVQADASSPKKEDKEDKDSKDNSKTKQTQSEEEQKESKRLKKRKGKRSSFDSKGVSQGDRKEQARRVVEGELSGNETLLESPWPRVVLRNRGQGSATSDSTANSSSPSAAPSVRASSTSSRTSSNHSAAHSAASSAHSAGSSAHSAGNSAHSVGKSSAGGGPVNGTRGGPSRGASKAGTQTSGKSLRANGAWDAETREATATEKAHILLEEARSAVAGLSRSAGSARTAKSASSLGSERRSVQERNAAEFHAPTGQWTPYYSRVFHMPSSRDHEVMLRDGGSPGNHYGDARLAQCSESPPTEMGYTYVSPVMVRSPTAPDYSRMPQQPASVPLPPSYTASQSLAPQSVSPQNQSMAQTLAPHVRGLGLQPSNAIRVSHRRSSPPSVVSRGSGSAPVCTDPRCVNYALGQSSSTGSSCPGEHGYSRRPASQPASLCGSKPRSPDASRVTGAARGCGGQQHFVVTSVPLVCRKSCAMNLQQHRHHTLPQSLSSQSSNSRSRSASSNNSTHREHSINDAPIITTHTLTHTPPNTPQSPPSTRQAPRQKAARHWTVSPAAGSTCSASAYPKV